MAGFPRLFDCYALLTASNASFAVSFIVSTSSSLQIFYEEYTILRVQQLEFLIFHFFSLERFLSAVRLSMCFYELRLVLSCLF